MRALIIATGYRKELEPLIQHQPTVLMKVLNKPIIYHVLDFLSTHHVKQCDLLINHLANQVEEAVGDGQAWGIKITYHLDKDAKYPLNLIRNLTSSWGDEPILLGTADVLPHFEKIQAHPERPLFFQFPSKEWSGWGIFPASELAKIEKNTTLEGLQQKYGHLAAVTKVQQQLSVLTFKDYMNSNIRAMSHRLSGILYPTTAHEVQKGVWLSRSVALHHGVKIEQPVFIGENCQIMSDTEIGPDAVIESNCIVDSGSKIRHSIISKNSYVGESLDIRDSIVDRNLLINLTHETSIRIKDDFILSEIDPPPIFRYPLRWIVRLFSLIFYGLLYPIYFYLKNQCNLKEEMMLQLPASNDSSSWKTFNYSYFEPKPGKTMNAFERYFRKIPVLMEIARGYVHLVGVPARTPEQVNQLPEDWKKLYLKSKVGLINLAKLDSRGETTPDDEYAAEAFYATQMSFWLDLKLFLRWLKRKIFG